jgi:glycosyltransferase involved in cell wall biosynthesis
MNHHPYVIALCSDQNPYEKAVLYARADRATRRWRARLVDYAGYRLAPRHWRALRLAGAVRSRIDHLVRESGVEIVEIEEAFGKARGLVRRSPIPVVVRLHGPWFLIGPSLGLTKDSAFRRRVRDEGRAIAGAAAVSSPSADVMRRVRAHYGLALADAEVIPNPVEPIPASDHWKPARCDRDRILFVGRFDRCKGADTMIDAFRRVAVAHPSSSLTFVGPDKGMAEGQGRLKNFLQYLTAQVPDPTVRRRVTWMGLQPPQCIAKLRRHAMVTVVCSRYEVFSYTAAEAMAYGCPLIATAVGGLTEIVRDDHNGLLCEPGDADDLAQRILTLLRNPELAARLGRQAAGDIQNCFHPEAIAKKTLEFYLRVIEKARATARSPYEL